MGTEQALLGWFADYDQVTVAYSGGVDSALVLAAAVRALGPASVHAVTARSPALPQGSWEAAAVLAAELAVRHTAVATNELDSPGYRANGADRCYFCKSTLVDAIVAIEAVRGPGGVIVTGTNADDVRDGWRPGIRAAAERGARTPLADSDLSKDEVRQISRRWQLPTWQQPASPCLSSRIAYGIPVSAARLARVDLAERLVRDELRAHDLPVTNLRVRDLGSAVRIEVDADQADAVRELPELAGIVATAGFDSESMTVREFRSGALNDALPRERRFA